MKTILTAKPFPTRSDMLSDTNLEQPFSIGRETPRQRWEDFGLQWEKLSDYFVAPSGREHSLYFDDYGASGRYNGLTICSVFQPLLNVSTLQPKAFEALLHVTDAQDRRISALLYSR